MFGHQLGHTMNRPAPISVFSDQRRTKSTIWSRVSCGTQTPVRVPHAFFLGPHVRSSARPHNEPPGADLSFLRPTPDEIHDLVPRVVRNPDPSQSSPRVFFRATCSVISSATQ